MIKKINFILKPILADLTFFGGLVFYTFLIFLFLSIKNYNLSIKLFIGLFSAYVIVIFIRLIYHKERPKKQNYSNFIEKIDSSSFPSLHALRISIIFFLVFNSYQNILIFLLFFGLLLVVSFSRYFLKKHFIIDILAGLFIGFLIFLLINLLY